MPEEDLVDIKFRLYDGSDIGPFRYSSAATVDVLKQRIVSDWPKGKTVIPKAANELKLISSGKILENNKTVGQCKVPLGDIGGGVLIMHVVVQPSLAKTKAGFATFHLMEILAETWSAQVLKTKPIKKKIDDSPKNVICSCSIL
ncbi:PREDICTED: membrane-anchored ubiquitin-fold protein 3 isoform X1 [Lupinus angustifolius]|uniref:membrane-anchored ubiquitin-fold protein 3 isoform X1 n=1 Tax=Lupinus angustifolius TaxID=3871 RepID=UPI00092FC8F3|nr:PREDICTED: membrane-anchored ubiquitin-fold protein 3 isoform X1 [Lupinus angustifolius]XP_019463359.1 PREDICTED: membrane-anchored ubiquitin-fold protein 3 isoform X1 [Lupinus angustifolius]